MPTLYFISQRRRPVKFLRWNDFLNLACSRGQLRAQPR